MQYPNVAGLEGIRPDGGMGGSGSLRSQEGREVLQDPGTEGPNRSLCRHIPARNPLGSEFDDLSLSLTSKP